jgi:DNA polymerase-3 subunit delta'
MSWQGIEGHDEVVEQFRQRLAAGRLASTYLFVGPPGIGKRTFALKLAQALLCSTRAAELLDPCGKCPSCLQVLAGSHPDVLRVVKPADKSEIPLQLLIGSKEKRMQEGLCHDISLKPFMGGRRIAIIDDADFLNEEGANSLLKTLEEPPPRSIMILIGTTADRQLPTIRSRCQWVRFRPLSVELTARLLVSQEIVSDAAEAQRLAEHAQGSLERAREIADPALWSLRKQFLGRLAEPRMSSVELTKMLGPFIDEAGKEAPARRARARQVVGFAVEFHRQLLRGLGGASLVADDEMAEMVERALQTFRGDEETAAACIERSLDALTHIDRNAHQSAWLECWLDDLERILTTRTPAAR